MMNNEVYDLVDTDKEERCVYCCITMNEHKEVLRTIYERELFRDGIRRFPYSYYVPVLGEGLNGIFDGQFIHCAEVYSPHNEIIRQMFTEEQLEKLDAFLVQRQTILNERGIQEGSMKIVHEFPTQYSKRLNAWDFRRDNLNFCSWNCVLRFGFDSHDFREQRETGMKVKGYLHYKLIGPILNAIKELDTQINTAFHTVYDIENVELLRLLVRLNLSYIHNIQPSSNRNLLRCFGGQITYLSYISKDYMIEEEKKRKAIEQQKISSLVMTKTGDRLIPSISSSAGFSKRKVYSFKEIQKFYHNTYNAFRDTVFRSIREEVEKERQQHDDDDEEEEPSSASSRKEEEAEEQQGEGEEDEIQNAFKSSRVITSHMNRKRTHKEMMNWFDKNQSTSTSTNNQSSSSSIINRNSRQSKYSKKNHNHHMNNNAPHHPTRNTYSSSSSSNKTNTNRQNKQPKQRKSNSSQIVARPNQQFTNFLRKKTILPKQQTSSSSSSSK